MLTIPVALQQDMTADYHIANSYSPPNLQWMSFDFVIDIHQSKEIVSYHSLDDE